MRLIIIVCLIMLVGTSFNARAGIDDVLQKQKKAEQNKEDRKKDTSRDLMQEKPA